MEELKFDELGDVLKKTNKEANICIQLYWLLFRNMVGLCRNPAALIGRIVISVFVSITCLALFWGFGNKINDETPPKEM